MMSTEARSGDELQQIALARRQHELSLSGVEPVEMDLPTASIPPGEALIIALDDEAATGRVANWA